MHGLCNEIRKILGNNSDNRIFNYKVFTLKRRQNICVNETSRLKLVYHIGDLRRGGFNFFKVDGYGTPASC